jgi:DNA-binding CsgD family transcriptional regulator
VARELGYSSGEALALAALAIIAFFADDPAHAVRLARLAQQLEADIPGWMGRICNYILTQALTEARDLAAARRTCAATLARSEHTGDLWTQVRLQIRMAVLDLETGQVKDAAANLREALQISLRTGGWFELQNCLDCCGHLCAVTGRWTEALTLWAAHAAVFQHHGSPYSPADTRRRHEPLGQARLALGPARAGAAEERGAAMSLTTAAEYALMLTALSLPPQAPGVGKLTVREQELVSLVAQGRTDAQIAAQLSISIRTVSSYLDRIRNKTGCRRRADLTRLALSAGLV